MQVVYKTNNDQVTVIGAAVTLHEALDAAQQLKKGTACRREPNTLSGGLVLYVKRNYTSALNTVSS